MNAAIDHALVLRSPRWLTHFSSPLFSQSTSSDYGSFTWPSAYVLAEYLWYMNRHMLQGRQILELGCGTGLPGLVAAACGASVLLTDDEDVDIALKNARVSLLTNNPVTWTRQKLENQATPPTSEPIFLSSSKIAPFTWASFSPQFLMEYCERKWPDLIIAADCFYDNAESFDAIFATLDFFFTKNPACTFITSYQVRSSHKSLHRLAARWGFKSRNIGLDSDAGFSFPHHKYDFSQDIQLLEISPVNHMNIGGPQTKMEM